MAAEIRVPTIGSSATKTPTGRSFSASETVGFNEPLAEIETDGTTFKAPASANGVLSNIILKGSGTVKAGNLLRPFTE